MIKSFFSTVDARSLNHQVTRTHGFNFRFAKWHSQKPLPQFPLVFQWVSFSMSRSLSFPTGKTGVIKLTRQGVGGKDDDLRRHSAQVLEGHSLPTRHHSHSFVCDICQTSPALVLEKLGSRRDTLSCFRSVRWTGAQLAPSA